MPPASSLIGNINIIKTIPTNSGVIIEFSMEDVATGQTLKERIVAPKNANLWSSAKVNYLINKAAINKIKLKQEQETLKVLDALRRGDNPLRDSLGNTIGTEHLTYAELAGRIFNELTMSIDPKDKIIGARLVQSLTDNELMAITGLDSVGIQALRDKASAAIQASLLMQQAGGNF